ncbi:MAG: hypothetical protein K1X86_15475 [Ignavibacteria bacterium]|nr:hypothetical protein [Ignavibacteria bacterium]
MKGHDFLLSSIEGETGEGGRLEFVKRVLSSSLFKIKEFPAVIVEEDQYDYGQLSGGGEIIMYQEPYNLAVIIKSENMNEFTDMKRRELKGILDGYVEGVLNVILDAANTADGIGEVRFGKSESYDLKIGTSPAINVIVPVTVSVLK